MHGTAQPHGHPSHGRGECPGAVGTPVGDQHRSFAGGLPARAELTSFRGEASSSGASQDSGGPGRAPGRSSIRTGHHQAPPTRPLTPCLESQGECGRLRGSLVSLVLPRGLSGDPAVPSCPQAGKGKAGVDCAPRLGVVFPAAG